MHRSKEKVGGGNGSWITLPSGRIRRRVKGSPVQSTPCHSALLTVGYQAFEASAPAGAVVDGS